MPGDEAAARRALAGTIQELWGSDEVRAASPTPLDEVHAGLVYFASTLHRVVPGALPRARGRRRGGLPGRGDRGAAAAHVRVLDGRRPRRQPERHGRRHRGGARDDADRLPAPARGADRAARPARLAVGPARRALARARGGARAARRPLPRGGRAARAAQPGGALPALLLAAWSRACARRARTPTAATGRPRSCSPTCGTAQRSLQTGQGQFVAATQLHDTIRQVEVFGFHFARLDIREHAGRHGAAIAEILSALGVHEAYESLAPAERSALLAREIAERRPLIPADLSAFSAETQEVVGTFRALGELLRGRHAGAVQSYVISGTEEPAHLLEVLLLMKESGLAEAGRRARAAADRPAVRVRGLARALPRDDARAARAAGLPARAARGRRRAGGDDRLLGLQQGRGLRRVGVGDLPRPGRARRGARAPRRRVGLLPRPRRRARPRRRPGQPGDPRPAARHGRRPHEDDRAGRGALRQVLAARDRAPRARAHRQRGAREHAGARLRARPRSGWPATAT